MNFVNELKSIMSKTAKGAVKVSNDVVDYTKYQIKIADLKDKIDEKYRTIGELFVKNANGEECEGSEFETYVDEVNSLKAELIAVREDLAKLKKSKQCPECGKMSGQNTNYCSNCGKKIYDTQE